MMPLYTRLNSAVTQSLFVIFSEWYTKSSFIDEPNFFTGYRRVSGWLSATINVVTHSLCVLIYGQYKLIVFVVIMNNQARVWIR